MLPTFRTAAVAAAFAIPVWTASFAPAALFDAAHVSAEAKWVLHYDVDASRATAYGKKFHQEHVATEKGQEKLAWVRDRYGIDLEKDLHGFTAYGNNYQPHSGVLLMHSKFDASKIEAVVKDEAGYRTSRHGNHVIHAWTAKHGKPGEEGAAQAAGHPVAAALVESRVVVIAGTEAGVKSALDVLDGKAKNLQGARSPLVFDVPAGTFFQGAAFSLTDLKTRPRPFPILQESNSARMTFGESAGKTSFSFDLDTGSMQRAKQVATMVEGLKAMLALQAEARVELAPIAQGLTVKQADSAVEIDWNVATDAVMKLGEKIRAERDARRAQREAAGEKRDD
ncbi:MAG: hypothetical protein WD069_22005 [Planctomycetales bacterium]